MATRIRHARSIARWYASSVLENAEIGFWAVENSDLNEDEIGEAQEELYRIAGRISARRAAMAAAQEGGNAGEYTQAALDVLADLTGKDGAA